MDFLQSSSRLIPLFSFSDSFKYLCWWPTLSVGVKRCKENNSECLWMWAQLSVLFVILLFEKHTHTHTFEWNVIVTGIVCWSLVVMLVTSIRPLRPCIMFIFYGVCIFFLHTQTMFQFISIILLTYSPIQNEVSLSWIHSVSFVRSTLMHFEYSLLTQNRNMNVRNQIGPETMQETIICFLC